MTPKNLIEAAAEIIAAGVRDGVPSDEIAKQVLNLPQPIATARMDRPILALMWGAWRVAKRDNEVYAKRPRPYWRAAGLSTSESRYYQPQWWAELPPIPEDANRG